VTLRIVGAGFGRTGTMSLKLALEELGVGACYHMTELAAHPQHAPLWLALMRGERVDLAEIFAEYAAAVDWPACAMWRELLAAYPDARVILTVRNAADWYESFSRTILARSENLPPLASPRIRALYDLSREVILRYTFGGRANDAQHAIAAYNAHNAAVTAAVPADKLLVYNVASAWSPLCEFLGVPIPDQPFPHANSGDDFRLSLRDSVGARRRKVTPTS
jgi:Sulfotransferase domain